eukprot:6201341-Pleurochrysis_carterae.AAC.4
MRGQVSSRGGIGMRLLGVSSRALVADAAGHRRVHCRLPRPCAGGGGDAGGAGGAARALGGAVGAARRGGSDARRDGGAGQGAGAR